MYRNYHSFLGSCSCADVTVAGKMDKAGQANRVNQCNPNHTPSGPGHQAGYHGAGGRADLNNHSNQLNPNNSRYQGGKK